jgi:hypothetical protein
MRYPWKRRNRSHARDKRRVAEENLENIRARWPQVRAAVAPLRREREINGWTATIATIFGDAHRKDSK